MKKEIHPGLIAGAVGVVILIMGFLAYKMFFQDTSASPNSEADKKAYAENRKRDAEIYQRTRGGMTNRMQQMSSGQPSKPSGN
jgi:hypothetical protein